MRWLYGSLAGIALVGCLYLLLSWGTATPEDPRAELADLGLRFPDCNFVLVSFDALQAAHVSCQGYHRKTTPTIDQMAAEGIRFARTYSVASWTVPASMTWFTGVYPSEHRMTNKYAVYTPTLQKLANLKELSPDLLTLAEVFRENGYATGGFTGNAGVSGGFGYEQGFDVYYHEQGVFGSMDQSIPRALAWVRENRDRRFFLFLHGYDIHGQNTPKSGFDYRFVERGYDGRYTGSEQEQEALREEGLESGKLTPRPMDVRFWNAIYDEKIQRTDEKFRHFLAEYRKIIPPGKTVFLLTSDHGTEFFEHNRVDHGFSLYNEQLHVPLILRLPNRISGVVVHERVSSIDVMPTILELMALSVPDRVQKQLRGQSLLPSFRGNRLPRPLFSETDYRQYTYKRSVITPDGWKLIRTMETQQQELYDLNSDPGETRNQAETDPERVRRMEELLFAHFKSIGQDLTARRWQVGLNPVYPSQGK